MVIKGNMAIHSLNGELDEATIIDKVGDNKYIAEYKGARCTAIFNPFRGCYYVDDVYGMIEDREQNYSSPKL